MLVSVDKGAVFNLFGVDTFNALESTFDNMSPSLVEYHLSSLFSSDNFGHLNKKEVETALYFGDYSIYLDYDKNIFIEIDDSKQDFDSLSLF